MSTGAAEEGRKTGLTAPCQNDQTDFKGGREGIING